MEEISHEEKMARPDKRLKLVLEDLGKVFKELEGQVDLEKLTPEQCIDIENKCRRLYVELVNEDLLPQNRLEPKS